MDGSQLFNMDYSSGSDEEAHSGKVSLLREFKDSVFMSGKTQKFTSYEKNGAQIEFGKASGDTTKAQGQKSYRESVLDFLLEQSKESSSDHLDSDDEESKMLRVEDKIARMNV